MSASCKSRPDRAGPRRFSRRRLSMVRALTCSLGLVWAAPALADCALQIAQAPPSVRLDYDPFVPANAPSRLAVKIQNPGGEACEADLALTDAPGVAVVRQALGQTGLMLELRPGAGLSRASQPFVFHVAVPAGETLETDFDVVIVEDAVVQAGLYSQPLTLELRQTGGSVAYDRAPVTIDVTALPRAQMNLSGSRGAFGSGASVSVVDFGEAQTGKTRQLFVQTRTNSAARLTFTSANRGRLRLQSEGDEDAEGYLDYAVAFEGGVLDLSQVATRDVDPPRTYAGQSYDLELRLGEVGGARAGRYNDELTIEISTL
jgi:hypothetical protein